MLEPNLPPSIHHLVSFPFTKKTVVYKDTDQLIADGFLKENLTTEGPSLLKDQEDTFVSDGFWIFLICISMKLSMVSHPLNPTDVQGRVTQIS